MSDDLVRRLRGCTDGTVSGKLRHEAASALIAKDAENARLRVLLAEAVELTDAWIDPRYGTPEDWDWREDVLSRMKAEIENRDG